MSLSPVSPADGWRAAERVLITTGQPAAAARQDNYFPWITSDAVIAVYHVHDGRNTRAVML